jgi:hypothetical protein
MPGSQSQTQDESGWTIPAALVCYVHLTGIRAAADALRELGTTSRLLAGGQAVERQAELVAGWGVTPIMLDDLLQIDRLADSLLVDQSD